MILFGQPIHGKNVHEKLFYHAHVGDLYMKKISTCYDKTIESIT